MVVCAGEGSKSHPSLQPLVPGVQRAGKEGYRSSSANFLRCLHCTRPWTVTCLAYVRANTFLDEKRTLKERMVESRGYFDFWRPVPLSDSLAWEHDRVRANTGRKQKSQGFNTHILFFATIKKPYSYYHTLASFVFLLLR